MLLINLVVCGITFYEVVAWGTDQNRSINNIYSFKVGDAIVPLPAAVLAAIVQSFYSQRAWGILNRSIIFAIYIVLCILASLAGAIGLVVYSRESLHAYRPCPAPTEGVAPTFDAAPLSHSPSANE